MMTNDNPHLLTSILIDLSVVILGAVLIWLRRSSPTTGAQLNAESKKAEGLCSSSS